MRKTTFKGAVFVPENGLYDLLRQRDIRRTYFNFHQIISSQLSLCEHGFKAKLFPNAQISITSSPIIHNSDGVVGITAPNPFPSPLMPNIAKFHIFFLPSKDIDNGDAVLEFSSKRILHFQPPIVDESFRISTAASTDLTIPTHSFWPQEMAELFYYAILKLKPPQINYFVEVINRKSPTQPANLNFYELPCLLAACPVGNVIGIHHDNDVRIHMKKDKDMSDAVQQVGLRILQQPYVIIPEEAGLMLECDGVNSEALKHKCNELRQMLTVVRQPDVGDDTSTDLCGKAPQFIVHLDKKKRNAAIDVDLFTYPYLASSLSKSAYTVDNDVETATQRLKQSLSTGSTREVIWYNGPDDILFIKKLAGKLLSHSIPLVWLKFHLYLDRHQGGTQMYLQKAFELASKQRAVIMINDAHDFFNSRHQKVSSYIHIHVLTFSIFNTVDRLSWGY